jgi:aminopeptidase N
VCLRLPPASGTGPASVRCELLAARQRTISLDQCVPWAYGNAGYSGYYRTSYSPDLLDRVIDQLPHLSPAERLGLNLDAWSARLTGDTTPAVVSTATGYLRNVHEYLTTSADREQYETWVHEQLSGHFQTARTALRNGQDGAETRVAALAQALALAGGDASVAREARTRVSGASATTTPAPSHPTLLAAFTSIAAATGGPAEYEWFLQQVGNAPTAEDRYRNLYALADFRDPVLLERTIAYALGDQVRSQDTALLIAAVFDNPIGRRIGWPIVERQWADLERKVGGFAGESRVVAALSAYCDERMRASIQRFFESHPVPEAARTLAQTLERIDSCVEVARRQTEPLASWLKQQMVAGPR